MKRSLLVIATSFVITLAIIFGIRASADALAVVLGVILGVVASVPTTVVIMYALTRNRAFNATNETPPQFSQQPPVVIVNASDKQALPIQPALPTLGPPASSRKWTMIGDVETEVES